MRNNSIVHGILIFFFLYSLVNQALGATLIYTGQQGRGSLDGAVLKGTETIQCVTESRNSTIRYVRFRVDQGNSQVDRRAPFELKKALLSVDEGPHTILAVIRYKNDLRTRLRVFVEKDVEPPIAASKYLDIVEQFADVVLTYAKDNYGPVQTPLFVDSLNVKNYKPYRWRFKQAYVLKTGYPIEGIHANFGLFQQLQVTLRELTNITGDVRYEQAAREAAEYALNNLAHKNGMLHWGHHETYDALNDTVVGLNGPPPIRLMQTILPDYRYLFSINPEVVKKDIEQYFTIGIRDWPTLAFTRHLWHISRYRNPWNNVLKINKNQAVPFLTDQNMRSWSFGLPFMDMGVMYYLFTGEKRAWTVVYQMLKRHMDMRHPITQLGPRSYGYLQVDGPNGKYVTQTHMDRYLFAIPLLLKKAEIIGLETEEGAQLLQWGLEELTAFANYLIVPGTDLYQMPKNLGERGSGKMIKIPPPLLWYFTLAYRLTGEQLMWEKARDIIRGYGLGDIGTPNSKQRAPTGTYKMQPIRDYQKTNPRYRNRWNNKNAFTVHALIELYYATNDETFLSMAEDAADVIIDNLYYNGLFVRQKNGLWARLSDMMPLALLHLVAARNGLTLEVDSVAAREVYERMPYGGPIKDKVWDNEFLYCQDRITGKCPT